MKWTDLTKEQQEFLLELDKNYPMPDGATHFDTDDRTSSSWLRLEQGCWLYYSEMRGPDWCPNSSLDYAIIVEIPAKPWYDPKDVSLNKHTTSCDKEPSDNVSSEHTKHNHYFKVWHGKLDVYRVLKLWNCTDPCIQHAVKKLLCAGGRGHKDFNKDIQDVIDTLLRLQEMIEEDV